MARSKAREYVWMQCTDCGQLNYRTNVKVQGGVPKLQLKKYCPHTRTKTVHKLKRK